MSSRNTSPEPPVLKYTSVESLKMAVVSGPTKLRSLFIALKPSFLGRHQMKPRTLRPTSYLDGLRGVAALFVVFNHYVSQYFPYITAGYRSDSGGNFLQGGNDRLIQLPIIRVIYSGRYMVTIFFVISGYVLSHKGLGLARRRDYSGLLKSLSSSVFRRWIRLMLPAMASAFIGFLLSRSGAAHDLHSDWDPFTRPEDPGEEIKRVEAYLPDSAEATFYNWILDCFIMGDPFHFGSIGFPKFGFILWTMQVEYMGSLIVFMVVLGTALLRQTYRYVVLMMLVTWCLCSGRWNWTLFIAGVLFAELSYENSPKHGLPLDTGVEGDREKTLYPPKLPLHQRLSFYMSDVLFFLAVLWLGTIPDRNEETAPGYRWLVSITPEIWGYNKGYFYPVFSAIFLVAVLERGKLQGLFTTRIAQYLGDISLSLYMLHTHIELSLGNWLVPKALRVASGFGPLGFTIGMTFALSICAVVTFWAADVFWRFVDAKAVRFARWFSNRCFVEEC